MTGAALPSTTTAPTPDLTPPMLLALDTATSYAAIALYHDGQLLAELNWRSQRRHTVELAPQVDNLLRLSGVTPDQIAALAVSIGPGSFTGARIALSYAKGVAAARDLPLIGVSTLDILAYPHLLAGRPICAMAAAGRGRFAWTVYESARSGEGVLLPRRRAPFRLGDIQSIMQALEPPILVAGELDARVRASLLSQWGDGAEIISPALGVRRGAALAELAWLRWRRGQTDDPATLSPIYLS